MEKRNIDLTDPQLFAISAGLLIMVAPCFYWLGILSATLFEKGIFVKSFLLEPSPGGEIFQLFVFIGLPLITLLINIRSRLGAHKQNRRLKNLQNVLMVLAGLCLLGAFRCTFFERLHILQVLYN